MRIKILALALIPVAALMISGCGKKSETSMEGAGSTVTPEVTTRDIPRVIYDELSSNIVNGRLEVNVSTPNMGTTMLIAERVVLGHPEAKSAMSILFYQMGQTPGKDVPTHRIDWTKAGGYKTVF